MSNTSLFNPAYDDLISSLDQIDALISIAMSTNITECNPKTAFNYLLAVSTLISKCKNELCENIWLKKL